MSENRNPDGRDETGGKTSSASRRGVLKSLGVAGAATMVGIPALSGSGAAEASGFDSDAFQKGVAERYGTSEAKIITKIVSKWYSRIEAHGLTGAEAADKATVEVLKNPNTPNATEDIHEYNHEIQRVQAETIPSSSVEKTDGLNSDSVSAQNTNINIIGGRKNKHGTFNTRVATYYDVGAQELNAVSNSAGIGEGHANCRIFGHYYPNQTRTYTVSTRYYRQGTVQGNASGKMNLYIRPHGEGIIRKKTESLDGTEGTNTSRAKRFYMNGGQRHTVGIELRTSSDGDLNYGSVADYYNSANRVTVHSLSVS